MGWQVEESAADDYSGEDGRKLNEQQDQQFSKRCLPSLVAIVPFPYGRNPKSGGELAAQNNLRVLSEYCDITILCITKGTEDEKQVEEMRLWAASVIPIKMDLSLKSLIKMKLSVLIGRPKIVSLYSRRNVISQIKLATSGKTFDFLICQFPQTAHFYQLVSAKYSIMDVQDAYSISQYRRFSVAKTFSSAISLFLEWLLWLRHEGRFYREFNSVLCLSEQDKFGLMAFNPAVIPTVISPITAKAYPPMVKTLKQNTVGFFGSFHHQPNIDGLLWFIEQVLPKLCLILPQVTFEIAGDGLPQSIVKGLPHNAKYCGFVDDISEFINAQSVIACPLISGGGVKIKTLQALQHGAAVVSTSIGVEGIVGTDGQEYLVRDDSDGFAEAIASIFKDQVIAEGLREAAWSKFANTRGDDMTRQFMRKLITDNFNG